MHGNLHQRRGSAVVMRHSPHAHKVSSSPPVSGGGLLWLWLAAIAMVTVGIAHLIRPDPPPQPTIVVKAAPALPAVIRNQQRQEFVFSNPQADRFTTFAREVENESDQYKREEMIGSWLAGVKLDEIREVLEFLQSATPVELAQDLSQRLIRQWTSKSPEVAAAWVEELPLEKQAVVVNDVAIVWANNQLTNAMTWAESLRDPAAKTQALQAIAGETVRSQPIVALQIAIDLPPNQQRDDLIRRGAMQWASEDAQSAAEWATQISKSELRDQTLGGIATVWSASDPVSAASFALKKLPRGRLLDDTIVSIVERWAQQQPEAAATWVDQFPQGSLRTAAMENLIAQWEQMDADSVHK